MVSAGLLLAATIVTFDVEVPATQPQDVRLWDSDQPLSAPKHIFLFPKAYCPESSRI